MHKFRIFMFIILSGTFAIAEDNGEAVMNAFLATFAKDNITWRDDIAFTNSPDEIPIGKQLGYSSTVGYYTYRAKDWSMLTPSEQEDVMNSPKLKSFIISIRNPNDMPQYSNQLHVSSVVSDNSRYSQSKPPKEERQNTNSDMPKAIVIPNSEDVPRTDVPKIDAPKTVAPAIPKTVASKPAPTPKATPFPTPKPEIKTYRIEPEDLVGKEKIQIDLSK